MELITARMTQAVKANTNLWTIELTDLGAHQAFMGYSLTSKYLMIGITAPKLESQISINSIPENEEEEIKIPLYLEKCDASLVGQINFKGLNKISQKWDVYFYDCRFSELTKVIDSVPIPIKKPSKNTRSEHLKLIGYTKKKDSNNPCFELRLKPKHS